MSTLTRSTSCPTATMAEPIETSSPVPLPGTPFLALYAANRWRTLVRQNAAQAQRRELLKLVRAAERTRFGRDHRFHSIGDVAAYHKRVPLRTYGQHWDEYWRDAFPRLVDCTWPGTMPYYAGSSGTSTGKIKYIPCSREMVASNKKAALDIFVHHLRNRPKNSRLRRQVVRARRLDRPEGAGAGNLPAATSAASPRGTCRGGSAAGTSRRRR